MIKTIKKSYKLGDEVLRAVDTKVFGRIAAQTAKQVILQKLHEAERDNTFSEFSDKEGELMEGVIRKIDERNIYVELGDKKIEGVMPPLDRVPTEKYAVGDRLKVFVKRVKNNGKILKSSYPVAHLVWLRSSLKNKYPKLRKAS